MPKAKFIVSQPGQRVRGLEISSDLISIGRRPDNTICLEGDTNVSKYHAVIEVRNGEFWLSDIGSSNGTTVNNELVNGARKLQDGDLIGVGGTSTLEFHPLDTQANNAPAPAASAAAVNLAPPAIGISSAPPAVPIGTMAAAVPTPPAVPKLMGLSPVTIAGGAIGLVLMGTMVALLIGLGVFGGSEAKNTKPPNEAPHTQPSQTPSLPDRDSSQTPPDTAAAVPEPETTVKASASSSPGKDATASRAAIADFTRTLAVQISQKSAYNFDPSFIALINNYTNEYRGAKGYYERARKYQIAIDKEFINVQGIQPPLIGYVMAMSRSKFVEKSEGGVWQLPMSVAKNYIADVTAADLNDPDRSTRIAAAYMKDLLDLFEREHFMYAVACYGMTLDEAGKIRTELENKDSGGQGRYDFWKMKNEGVVRGDQVERVARFFAAGIVCENPRQFGLNDRPLSSLY